jgi:GxxExxY protein
MTITPNRRAFDDSQTFDIIGAAMMVHRVLGCGFLEPVYRAALQIELTTRGIPYISEVRLPVKYRGHILPLGYRVDFICFGEVLVEIKALAAMGPIEQAQVINYLRAANLHRALLINFGTTSLQHKRLVWNLSEGQVPPTPLKSA